MVIYKSEGWLIMILIKMNIYNCSWVDFDNLRDQSCV